MKPVVLILVVVILMTSPINRVKAKDLGSMDLITRHRRLATLSVQRGTSSTRPKPPGVNTGNPITANYDFTPKYRIGDKDFFSFALQFNRLAPGGKSLGTNLVKGYFQQEVIARRPDGAPVFRVTRANTRLVLTDENGKEILNRVLGFGEGLTYEVCFEEPFSFFPVDTTGWPRDIMGFMMFEQVYASHQFFQTVMTRTHGGIQHLRQPGMTVVMPDSNKSGPVGLAPLANLDLTRGESTLEFLGTGLYQQQQAMILFFDIPYIVEIHEIFGNKNGAGRELLRGFIWVSPGNNKILGGRLLGANFVAFPGAGGKLEATDVALDGKLERLTPREYAQQTRAPGP